MASSFSVEVGGCGVGGSARTQNAQGALDKSAILTLVVRVEFCETKNWVG